MGRVGNSRHVKLLHGPVLFGVDLYVGAAQMTTLEEVIAQQCEIIGELMADADEVRALAEADGFDTNGSLRDCYRQLQEERDALSKDVNALEDDISDKDEEITKLTGQIEQMDKNAEIEAQKRDDDISDALSDLCVALGYAARPIRLTGIPELDALVRAVWG
jgi:predicted transcriptional regulator